jgi:hypothetical protein
MSTLEAIEERIPQGREPGRRITARKSRAESGHRLVDNHTGPKKLLGDPSRKLLYEMLIQLMVVIWRRVMDFSVSIAPLRDDNRQIGLVDRPYRSSKTPSSSSSPQALTY